jgi:hypothetical protein
MKWVCDKCRKGKAPQELYGKCDKCKSNGWVKEVK